MARQAQAGFTLVEILLTIGIVAVLFVLSVINLGQPQASASVSGTADTLAADLRAQQLLAMGGAGGSTSTQQPEGIYVQGGQYALFAGSSYTPADTNNYTVTAGDGIALSTTLPSSTVVFNKGSGEVSGFTSGSNTITVTGAGNSKTVTINKFGAITVN